MGRRRPRRRDGPTGGATRTSWSRSASPTSVYAAVPPRPIRRWRWSPRSRVSWKQPVFVGDIGALKARLTALTEAADARRGVLAEEKKAAREATAARRVEIADEAESLANSTAWKVSGQRFRDLLEEMEGAPRFDKAAEQAQWERFSAARSTFDKARRHHFAELDASRAEAVTIKEGLIRRAQALSSSTDWGATSRAYRDLMAEWKAAPRGRPGRRRPAVERVPGRTGWLLRRPRAADSNVVPTRPPTSRPKALLVEAEALVPASDIRTARGKLADLMDKWDAIGFVPRSEKAGLDRRLRAVENQLRDAERAVAPQRPGCPGSGGADCRVVLPRRWPSWRSSWRGTSSRRRAPGRRCGAEPGVQPCVAGGRRVRIGRVLRLSTGARRVTR